MRKFILIALSLLAIVAVSCKEETKAENIKKKIEISSKKVNEKVKSKKDDLVLNMSNPGYMAGSPIYKVISSCIKGEYIDIEGDLLSASNFVSLKESGMTKGEAEDYIQKNKKLLLNTRSMSQPVGKDILVFKTSISITKNIFKVRYVVENDSCKIVLPIME